MSPTDDEAVETSTMLLAKNLAVNLKTMRTARLPHGDIHLKNVSCGRNRVWFFDRKPSLRQIRYRHEAGD
jgi:aminoglycoside phosphotransferase family enzyme